MLWVVAFGVVCALVHQCPTKIFFLFPFSLFWGRSRLGKLFQPACRTLCDWLLSERGPETQHDHRLVSVGCFVLPNPSLICSPLASIVHRRLFLAPSPSDRTLKLLLTSTAMAYVTLLRGVRAVSRRVCYAHPYFGHTLAQ